MLVFDHIPNSHQIIRFSQFKNNIRVKIYFFLATRIVVFGISYEIITPMRRIQLQNRKTMWVENVLSTKRISYETRLALPGLVICQKTWVSVSSASVCNNFSVVKLLRTGVLATFFVFLRDSMIQDFLYDDSESIPWPPSFARLRNSNDVILITKPISIVVIFAQEITQNTCRISTSYLIGKKQQVTFYQIPQTRGKICINV